EKEGFCRKLATMEDVRRCGPGRDAAKRGSGPQPERLLPVSEPPTSQARVVRDRRPTLCRPGAGKLSWLRGGLAEDGVARWLRLRLVDQVERTANAGYGWQLRIKWHGVQGRQGFAAG